MKKTIIAFLAFTLLVPAVAMAVDEKQAPVLDAATCNQLMVEYQPPADINQNADYVPGVDVHGKPVVEADINPSAVTVPETVTFPLTVDVARYAGIPRPKGTEMDATMGMVSINTKTNQVSYNGQVLESSTVSALRDLCPQQAKKGSDILKGSYGNKNILKGDNPNQDILKGSRGDKNILEGN